MLFGIETARLLLRSSKTQRKFVSNATDSFSTLSKRWWKTMNLLPIVNTQVCRRIVSPAAISDMKSLSALTTTKDRLLPSAMSDRARPSLVWKAKTPSLHAAKYFETFMCPRTLQSEEPQGPEMYRHMPFLQEHRHERVSQLSHPNIYNHQLHITQKGIIVRNL
jgi:hypothetical protein